jgi:hypothetical protein
MPPCDAQYLLGYFFEIGPAIAAGMGNGPITHAELQAWQGNTGIELNAWEARLLKQLSVEYVNQQHLSSVPDCPAPWSDAPYAKASPNLVALRMKQSIRGMTQS